MHKSDMTLLLVEDFGVHSFFRTRVVSDKEAAKERIRKALSSEQAVTMGFLLRNLWPYATLLLNKRLSFPPLPNVFLGSAYRCQFYLQVLHLKTRSDDINCPTSLHVLNPTCFLYQPG